MPRALAPNGGNSRRDATVTYLAITATGQTPCQATHAVPPGEPRASRAPSAYRFVVSSDTQASQDRSVLTDDSQRNVAPWHTCQVAELERRHSASAPGATRRRQRRIIGPKHLVKNTTWRSTRSDVFPAEPFFAPLPTFRLPRNRTATWSVTASGVRESTPCCRLLFPPSSIVGRHWRGRIVEA
jgi:hypothetical protein